jgi:hypothetical protein
MNHTGHFTIGTEEHDGSSTRLCSPASDCKHVRCDCGWERDTGSLREAKGLLAVHQHEALNAL